MTSIYRNEFSLLNQTFNLNNYNVLLVDLWGVLHDGYHLYPGSLATLYQLKQLNKDVILVSNAPRRKSTIKNLLDTLGIHQSLYKALIVSGELLFSFLKEKKIGSKYFYIGSVESGEIISSFNNYQRVDHPQSADFIILTSVVNCFNQAMDCAIKAIRYKVPLLCANPDILSIRQNGELVYCSGTIARKYEQLGGEVIYFGKPYKNIYLHALEGISLSRRILAIGDSMENDIQGAINMNIDSALVCSGIHMHDLKINVGELPNKNNLLKLYKKYLVKPKFVLSIMSDIMKSQT